MTISVPSASRLPYALLLGLIGLLSLPAGAQGGPGRIAVAGELPSGYVGCLARYGLPRDTLSNDQLGDVVRLARYNLVIVAGMPTQGETVVAALRAVLAAGGSVLLDYSQPSPLIGGLLGNAGGNGWVRSFASYGIAGSSRSAFHLVGQNNPLASDAKPTEDFPPSRAGLVPLVAGLKDVTVLAEYRATSPLGQGLRGERGERGGARRAGPETGPPGPAIAWLPSGNGKIMICGPGIAMGTQLMGSDFDQLILGMVRFLTNGRAVAQLEPDMAHLGRKQSARSLGDKEDADPQPAAVPMPAAPTPADTVPDARPAGSGTAAELPKGYISIEPQTTVQYDLSGKLGAGSAELVLNYWNPTHLLRVVFGPKSTDVVKLNGQYTRTLASAPGRVAPGTAVLVKERWDKLTVLAGTVRIEAVIKGIHAGGTAAKGFDGEVEYQSVEEVFFADDFMRTNDKNGGWTVHGGAWQTAPVENPDMGANPFSYKVDAPGLAVATIGYPFWDEYRFRAALRPVGTTGKMGLGWYARDERNMYQFRAAVRGGGPAVADGFQLVKLRDGKPEVLAGLAGGLTAGQWYKVMVKAEGPALSVYLDDVKLFTVQDGTFPGGQIALFAEGTSARFDDVLVEPVNANTDQGQRLAGRVPDYAGLMDVDSWAGPATPWLPAADVSGLFWRCNSFFGDVGIRYDLPKLPDGAKLMLLADGDGETAMSGVNVTVERQGGTGQVTLRQGGTVLGRGTAKLADGVSLALRKRGNRVQGLIGDETVVSGTTTIRGGGRLAFQVTGLRPSIGGLAVWSSNLRDYTFDTAPVDWWVGSGTWDVTNRWSCTPDWSWFGGYAHDVAAVWYKQPLEGDVVMDFYVGPKMLGNDFEQKERTGDFNAALCGDGHDVRSGYSFLVGPGRGRTAQILRKGEVVAQDNRFQLFQKGHNRWADVRVERHGAKLSLVVDGQTLVEYTDPDPLPGGYVALWTQNNGVMLPRITLSFAAAGDRLLSLR